MAVVRRFSVGPPRTCEGFSHAITCATYIVASKRTLAEIKLLRVRLTEAMSQLSTGSLRECVSFENTQKADGGGLELEVLDLALLTL